MQMTDRLGLLAPALVLALIAASVGWVQQGGSDDNDYRNLLGL